jgi:putative FmdB family regulatory protein
MPTYDYECANGHSFEYLQSMSSDPLTKCINCGAQVRRLIGGGTGVIFKGSGFYVNDSKSKSNGSGKSAAKETGSDEPSTPKTDAAAASSKSAEGTKSTSDSTPTKTETKAASS